MKIRDGFLLRKLANTNVIIPFVSSASESKRIFTLNETGMFLWRKLMEGSEVTQLAKALSEEYRVDPETAKEDTGKFIEMLKQVNMLDETI